MYVRNVHSRDYDAEPETLGALLDTLASDGDLIWPAEHWPRMRFDRPLGVGATGGHGPIRYFVEAYEPGQSIVFRFTAPRGFDGSHTFMVERLERGARLTHLLVMDTSMRATLPWTVLYRPLHDALVEEALDRAADAVGEAPAAPPWSWYVRLLRSIARRRGKRA